MEDDDPLQWELDQLQKLDQLAAAYGWDPAGRDYKSRTKLIRVQSVARQKANAKGLSASRGASTVCVAGAAAVSKAVSEKRPKPAGWVTTTPGKGKRFKGFTSAKALLGEPSYGPWITDRDAPSGIKPTEWRRFISVDKDTGDFTTLRCR